MRLSDTDYTLAQREMLERVMEPGEDIRWYGRPDAMTGGAAFAPILLFSAMWVCIPSFILWETYETDGWKSFDLTMCIPMLFAVIGLVLPVVWLRHFKRTKQSVYVLTEKRAILLSPKMLSGTQLFSYPIEEDMLLAVKRKKDGSGDLVFDYSDVVVNDRPLPRGFLKVRNVDKPLSILKEMGVKISQQSLEL